jgi:hypothetical protein
VLWYSRVATPAPGDLVLYTLPGLTVTGQYFRGNNANYVFQGQWIGRIIAAPGQTVSRDDAGRWMVDGVVTAWQPLTSPSLDGVRSWKVPEGFVFVMPDNLLPPGAPFPEDALRQIYLVPAMRIAGRLYFRSLPLLQMSRLD